MAKKFTKKQCLPTLEALFTAAALAMSIASSMTAYALSSLPIIVAACAAAILIAIAAVFAEGKMPPLIYDAMFFATALLTGFSLCTVVRGRILLIGYIYFSDLESSNPVAMRITICSRKLSGAAL